MGKRNRKAKQSQVAEAGESLPRNVKRESLEIASQLLEKCSNQCCGGTHEWETYMELYQMISRLRTIQSSHVMKEVKREEHLEEFMAWMKTQDVDTSPVTIQQYDYGLGLKAQNSFKENDLVLTIPRKVMMSTQTAKDSALGPLIEQDRILQTMPNVVLALHILCEKNDPESFWKPYLNVLPETYTTPLYFTPEEVQLLKGSPVFDEIINQYRSIARQYAYFFKLFNSPGETKLPLKIFCYDDYRWAVSTVMTRQNQIPSATGHHMLTALIPLWDMANHTNGQLTTDFSVEEDCSKCYALRKFDEGEQVFIFYGSRSNAELLLHNGFIYSQNQCDRISIKLGISKNDPLYNMKAEVLSRLTLLPSRQFNIHTGEDPVDSDTLAYLRVFNMTQDELQQFLSNENGTKPVGKLRDFGEIVSIGNEDKVWKFLETRAQLLVRVYPTEVQEDKVLLEGDSLNAHQRVAIQLRLAEKKVLRNAESYALDYRTKLHEQLQMQLQEMALEKARQSRAAIASVDEALDELENLDSVQII